MRKTWWLGALFVAASMVLPALAQQPAGQPNANQFFTGVNPREIKTVKVDPTKAMKQKNLAGALTPSAAQRSTKVFSMNGMVPKVTLGSWPPKLPSFAVVKTPQVQPSSTTVTKGGSFAGLSTK